MFKLVTSNRLIDGLKTRKYFSRSHALRGNACLDAPRPARTIAHSCRTRSVREGIPTQSVRKTRFVGTRKILLS